MRLSRGLRNGSVLLKRLVGNGVKGIVLVLIDFLDTWTRSVAGTRRRPDEAIMNSKQLKGKVEGVQLAFRCSRYFL